MNPYADILGHIGPLPDDYLVLDTETLDRNPNDEHNLATQIGNCLVFDRAASSWGSIYLDWTKSTTLDVSEEWYRGRIEEVTAAMAEHGKTYHATWDKIEAHGVAPEEALVRLANLIADAGDMPVVGFNFYNYDRKLLERLYALVGIPFTFPPGKIVDTGMIEKALRIGWVVPATPLADAGERDAWTRKMAGIVRRGKWSLDSVCVPSYGLDKRADVDPAMAHDAGFDCFLNHHHLESIRERAALPACAVAQPGA